jgi:hypothetical protein
MGDPTMRSESLYRVRAVTTELEEKYEKKKALSPSIRVQSMSELLGDRIELFEFIQLYWDVMENTYRVLHGPTFWKNYQAFCEEPSTASEAFIAILLLIVASVRCLGLRKRTLYRGIRSVDREEAMISIKACENWISKQSRDQSSIELVQIRVLLYIAKRANSIHKRTSWEEATSLKHYSLNLGLHRDAKLLEKVLGGCDAVPIQRTSALEKEMRRRLWTTIKELELQAAFDAGFPSSLASLPADCGIPSNINDEDLDESSTQQPPSKSPDIYTANSFVSISSRSFTLRSVINRIINESRMQSSYDQLLQYHDKVIAELGAMPAWVDSHRQNITALSPAAIPALLLDIQLRQYLLLIHLPFAQLADANARYVYSRMICLNAANLILEYHCKLAASGYHSLIFLRGDIFRAGLAMCHSIISWNSIKGKCL